MTGCSSSFDSYSTYHGEDKVRVADGSLSPISGHGSIHYSPTISLSKVLHVPKFPSNLLSVSSLTHSLNCSVTFFPTHCVFQELATRRLIGGGKVHGGLYFLEQTPSPVGPSLSCGQALEANVNSALPLLHQWHRRLGHPSFGILEKLFPSLTKRCPRSQFFCEACELAKHHRSFYAPVNQRSASPFMVIHSDVWGLSPVTSLSGYRWFVTFIDCYSRVTWVYLLKAKNEAFSCFQSFHRMVCTQFDAKIKVLRSDKGTEYIDGSFRAYLDQHGILYQTSCVGTPQQNGVAERKNRHLAEVARSLLLTMNVPKHFWGEAVLTAAYLINRMPSSVLQFQTPLSVLPVGSRVSSLPPKIFGCICFVHAPKHPGGKLDPKARKCVFLGYSPTQKGYKCYDPHSRKMFVSMDVTFWETKPFYSLPSSSLQGENHDVQEEMMRAEERLTSYIPESWSYLPVSCHRQGETENSGKEGETGNSEKGEDPTSVARTDHDIAGRLDMPNLKTYARREKGKSTCAIPLDQSISPDPVSDPSADLSGNDPFSTVSYDIDTPTVSNDLDAPIALRKGVRTCTKHPISQFVSYSHLSPSYRAFVSSLSSVSIPQDWKEAITLPKWKEAMVEEMTALKKNGTWELVSLPKGKRSVGC